MNASNASYLPLLMRRPIAGVGPIAGSLTLYEEGLFLAHFRCNGRGYVFIGNKVCLCLLLTGGRVEESDGGGGGGTQNGGDRNGVGDGTPWQWGPCGNNGQRIITFVGNSEIDLGGAVRSSTRHLRICFFFCC